MIPLADVIRSRTWPIVTTALVVVNALVLLVSASFSVANVLTSLFVHGGLGHVAGTLLYLWIFGDNVEDRLGHGRFLAFYLVAGAASALAQAAMDPPSVTPIVGATGAVAGVLGGYTVLYPHSRVLTLVPLPVLLVEVPAKSLLALWFVVQLASGLNAARTAVQGPLPGGVAFWAQVVAFVTGAALARMLQRPERARVEWWSP